MQLGLAVIFGGQSSNQLIKVFGGQAINACRSLAAATGSKLRTHCFGTHASIKGRSDAD